MEGLSEMGLSKTVVRSDTKWTALLRKDRGLPISKFALYVSPIKIKSQFPTTHQSSQPNPSAHFLWTRLIDSN